MRDYLVLFVLCARSLLCSSLLSTTKSKDATNKLLLVPCKPVLYALELLRYKLTVVEPFPILYLCLKNVVRHL